MFLKRYIYIVRRGHRASVVTRLGSTDPLDLVPRDVTKSVLEIQPEQSNVEETSLLSSYL